MDFSVDCMRGKFVVQSSGMKSDPHQSLPVPTVLQEIEAFRDSFREAMKSCASRMDENLDAIRDKVDAISSAKKPPGGCGRDLRDMLTLLRSHKANPEKGRLKDIKKFHGVAEDLAMITETW